MFFSVQTYGAQKFFSMKIILIDRWQVLSYFFFFNIFIDNHIK